MILNNKVKNALKIGDKAKLKEREVI